ncbi:hypothetical protein ACFL4G_11960 [Thermodesulfobacteriota bacterium]
MTSADQFRILALAGSAVFTATLWIVFRPRREILKATLIPAGLFATLDLLIEWATYNLGIWVCIGSWQILHVPIIMTVQFVVLGVGLCLVVAESIKRLDIRFFRLFIILFPTCLGIILWLLEYAWRDMGITVYLEPYTGVVVLGAWQALLWTLVTTFLARLRRDAEKTTDTPSRRTD